MEIHHNNRKKTVALVSGVFALILIGFTLFSQTLMSLTLPKVTLASVIRGDLHHEYQSSGVLKWKVEKALSSNAGWKVKQVSVKQGDVVQKGQELIAYDGKEMEQQLLDEQDILSKLKLTKDSLQYAVIEAKQGEDAKAINDATNAYKSYEIDIDIQQRRIQKLQDSLLENAKLVAPFEGVVTKVSALEGFPSSGEPDIIVASQSLGLELELHLPDSAVASLKAGDEMDVLVNEEEVRQIIGRVVTIQDDEAGVLGYGEDGDDGKERTPMKNLQISIEDHSVKEGMSAKVILTQSVEDVLLVAHSAIHEENDKKYVFGLEQKAGPLGNAFYVRKMYITVADSNESQSAVTGELFEEEQIIMESSEPLQEGEKIRMQPS
ncbi:efflux RND transporter periplasmic adaptor subunit [Paenibacillus sp. 2TAB23]|uniref:efflux RND transporter periplasmic adaptor subunit n=1 Tax=Paenibacillus sp. 2TAB23 TaxID=3233004 RepID=UPI003F9C0E95